MAVRPASAYVDAVQVGSDGSELSDYDLVGSRRDASGIFALDQVDQFDLLYLPPPGKGVDVGPAALLAAERYCRRRSAMLIVDPATGWQSPEDVVDGIRHQGYASPNMLGYFPRLRDREDEDGLPRAVGGALAGLLCKLDRSYGPWSDLDQRDLGFGRNFDPVVEVNADDVEMLEREGINVLASGPAGRPRLVGSMTMARGSEMQRPLASLTVRRLCLRIVNSIEQATRWAVFVQPGQKLAKRI